MKPDLFSKPIPNILGTALVVTLAGQALGPVLGTPRPIHSLGWIFIANTLMATTMHLALRRSALAPVRPLFFWIFMLSFTIGAFNILVEAYIFHVTTLEQTLAALGDGFVTFLLLSGGLAYSFRKKLPGPRLSNNRSPLQWTWRIALGALLYLFVYFIAGALLQASLPALGEFYKDKLPPIGLILETQIFRGLVFSSVAILFLRGCRNDATGKSVILGLFFTILGGIAPLIPPNEFMPLNLRVGHGIEVGISNFIYGLLLARLLNPSIRQGNKRTGQQVSEGYPIKVT